LTLGYICDIIDRHPLQSILKWENLRAEFLGWDKEKQSRTLFLENHPEYPAYLLVNSFDPLFAHTLKETIGEYRAIHKLDINKLLTAADEAEFEPVVFTSNPEELFNFIDTLEEPLPVELGVELYPFQLRGFNYLKDLPSSICNWSTGTGKSIFAVAWSKYLLETDQVDKIVVLSKSHNKYNWTRQFENIGDLQAAVDDSVTGGKTGELTRTEALRRKRGQLYIDSQIFIINYEKLRYRPEDEKARYLSGRKMPSASGDGQELEDALRDERVAWILDEAPTKLKSMTTGWYKGLSKLQNCTNSNKTTALTATKLEKNPEDLYAWVKVLNKEIWPTKAAFRSMYARRMLDWRVLSWDADKLPEIGMRLAHMTSRADKYLDPEIREQFPEHHHEDVFVDLYPGEYKIYEAVRDEVKQMAALTTSALAPLQIVCNNMSLLSKSSSGIAQKVAAKYLPSDRNLAKLEKLQDMLDEIPGKVVIFSAFTEFGSLMLVPYMQKWGHRYVVYSGNAKQKQEAQDRFTNEPGIKVFLSSDQGSDSINLEQASSVIHYDLPWNASTLIQRQNRIHRITSEHAHVFSYSLIASRTLEEKKLALIAKKIAMENAVDSELISQAELLADFSVVDLRSLID